jgi:Tol biopolymer transport system component
MWTRDGASVVFSSMRGGPALLRSRRANGTGDDALLLENALINRAGDWTPGGELILLQVRSDADLYVLRPGSEPRLYYGARGDRGEPRLSPDGTWVAYRSTETGRGEIFVSRFPDANGERIQVSRTGALAPQWSHDGRELFFNNGPEVWSARLMAGGTFAEPVRLFASPFLTNDPIEVAADGRFLMVVDDQPAPVPTELQLTFNIGAYVRRRAGSQ